MKQMTTEEIKNTFLDYFQNNGHLVIPKSGIIPKNDPTLLFINAGMAPLKDYFLQKAIPPSKRLTNYQDCIRLIDIDSIGDSYHGTSFRMMGSWSFGDYFKEDSIELAFKLITEIFGFPKEKLYATVFVNDGTLPGVPDDFESAEIWKKYLPADHIIPSPPCDNFWGPPGNSGPCGPCTEVFFDRGESFGSTDESKDILITGRHIEIWNAGVFMEYFMDEEKNISLLPQKCVDTGAGMERFAMILQNKNSIHEIDQYEIPFSYVTENVSDLKWSRIIFDHLKTSLLMLQSGIKPSNQKEGYLLRRLIRRSLTGMYLNGCDLQKSNDFLSLISEYLEKPAGAYVKDEEVISIFSNESALFSKMLIRNKKHFDKIISEGNITGDYAFELKATYGVPEDLVRELCNKYNIAFPEDDFLEKMTQHKEVSKK